MFPVIAEKMHIPTNSSKIMKIFSFNSYPWMSPYPMVVAVVVTK